MGWTGRDILLCCFCCQSLPKFPFVTRSSCTKTAYLLFFLTALILFTAAFYSPETTRKFPFCKGDNSFICKEHSNFLAIYRICFTYVLFFTLLCIFTFGLSSSRSYRSVVHNGFWFFKIAFIVCLLVGSAYIPHGLFDKVFMYFGLFFVLSFNLFEMVLYIQVVRDFTTVCRYKCLRDASACTKFIVTFFVLLLQGVGMGLFIVLFIIYNHCVINLVFTIVNMTLSYLISLGSFVIKLHRRDWNSVLGGSVLTSHVMLLTWSAVTNNSRDECNPSQHLARIFFASSNYINLFFAGLTTILGVAYFFRNWEKEKPNSVTYVENRGKELFGFWGKRNLVQTIQPEDSTIPPEGVTYKSTDPDDDEYDHVKYFWNSMHKLFLLATFYFMICFTYNYDYSTFPSKQIFYNEAAMWFKIVSSWLCMLSFVVVEFLPESTRAQITEHS